jgi:hypothetical protein
MVAELLRHPADAATGTELPQGGADRLRHDVGARHIRSLQARGEQRLAPGVVHVQAGWRTASPARGASRRTAPGLIVPVSYPRLDRFVADGGVHRGLLGSLVCLVPRMRLSQGGADHVIAQDREAAGA